MGGQVSFGRDPVTGGGFLTIRGGVGIGGGISWSPDGGRPGAEPDQCNTGGIGAGVFGSLGFNAGPLQAGLETNAGVNFNNRGDISPYGAWPTPSWGFGNSWGIHAAAAAGGEVTFYSPRNPTGNN